MILEGFMEKIKNLKVNMEAKILAASNVVIVPHNGIDFDAIGSAVGLSSIVRKLKKQPIIVVDDPIYKMDHGVGLVIEDAKKETIILTREKYLQAKDDKDLYILTDVNNNVIGSFESDNRFIPIGYTLQSLSTVVIDAEDSAHFNDVLYSTCSTPLYAFKLYKCD